MGSFLGLKMALDKGSRRLLVESDPIVLVSFFKCALHDLHPLASLLHGCHHLISRFDQRDLSHILEGKEN